MSFNKYNTRNSGRYNTPGQFVPGGELVPGASQLRGNNVVPPRAPPVNTSTYSNTNDDVDMGMEQQESLSVDNNAATERPPWMKTKLTGVKKISKKERRRRQNENLRRLLAPKNALMVLNEMLPNEQLATQFKVEPTSNVQYYKSNNSPSFCADLTLEGNTYKGYGENKLSARNAAAEQAIRDLILKRMNKVLSTEVRKAEPAEGQNGEGGDEEALPMIQLASFALHKLFSEWEYEGHKVPQLKPVTLPLDQLTSTIAGVQQLLLQTSAMTSESGAEAAAGPAVGPAPPTMAGKTRPKKPKELPTNARAMHPCMLLTYMRPQLEYRELAVEGDKPQNMLFTMGVDVDGATYIGKASNKKEARKAAARAACQALFDVKFDEVATANAPQPLEL